MVFVNQRIEAAVCFTRPSSQTATSRPSFADAKSGVRIALNVNKQGTSEFLKATKAAKMRGKLVEIEEVRATWDIRRAKRRGARILAVPLAQRGRRKAARPLPVVLVDRFKSERATDRRSIHK